ncbi:helix-turn-helix domain-containing protein [Pseudomonas chlororaphis]|uniref:helix-turn-helix domain-containing protein n=1 Tax=Pseudomonas chlororaphis TaxID=587753 RepID=UPI0015DE2A0C|nr:LexA family transcriptional regulator [Pseudomonas chlororaphis]QLL11728.1 helix-turn-helix domain-containing protein [Pseudomonas chlororaphis subsp. aurantiaca]
MNIGDRILAEMASRDWSEGELSRRSGVTQPTIHRIVSGESENPRQANIEKIAKALRLPSDWLWRGGPRPSSNGDSGTQSIDDGFNLQNTVHSYSVPLISLSQALNWISGDYKMSDLSEENRLPCPVMVGARAFAFLMPNDSMVGSRNEKPIYEGAAVFIDPDLSAEAGNTVLASIDGRPPIIGVLIEHGGKLYVKPANVQFEKEEVSKETKGWYLGRAVFTGHFL